LTRFHCIPELGGGPVHGPGGREEALEASGDHLRGEARQTKPGT